MSITTTAIPHIPAMDGARGRSHFPITVPLNSCNHPQTVIAYTHFTEEKAEA